VRVADGDSQPAPPRLSLTGTTVTLSSGNFPAGIAELGRPVAALPGSAGAARRPLHAVAWRGADTEPVSGHEDFELGTDGPKMIVVGLDGSRTSWRAASYANGLARRQHSQVTVVYVVSPGALATMSADAVAAMAAEDVGEEIGAGLREQVERLAAERGVDTEFLIVRGDPLTELRRVAQEVRADALVVGASERAGHRFVGSLAGRLVKAARWPVTVVP
jgi:nucleotide-binding universal stress UspA family protein